MTRTRARMTRGRGPGLRGWTTAVLAGAYIVMWIGGVTAYVSRGGPGSGEAWTAPAFLFVAALIVVVSTRSGVVWLGVVLLVGFVAEYVGLRWDVLFGSYEYTDALRPRALGVPIVICGAWMVLVAYVRQGLAGWAPPVWLAVTMASAWTTAVDLVIDPVAAGPLRYWTWADPGGYHGVPARNFAGWFVVSVLMFLLLSRAPAGWPGNAWARYVGVSIIAFFTIIAASRGLTTPAGIGAALCVLDALVARRRSTALS